MGGGAKILETTESSSVEFESRAVVSGMRKKTPFCSEFLMPTIEDEEFFPGRGSGYLVFMDRTTRL